MLGRDVYHIIEQIAQTSTRSGKEALLRQHAKRLTSILQATYNPYRTYGIQRIPDDCAPLSAMPARDLRDVLRDLEARQLTGNDAQEAIRSVLRSLSAESGELFARILRKDLRMGVGVKTINKVIPGCIPEFGCMLAQPFDAAHAAYPAIAEPKLDGVRVIADVDARAGRVTFFSRSGQEFPALNHLSTPMLELVNGMDIDHTCFDGEVIAGSFNETVSQARRKGQQAKDARYVIFDWIDEARLSLPYVERRAALIKGALRAGGALLGAPDLLRRDEPIGVLRGVTVCDEAQVRALYADYLKLGYEGLMLKDPDSRYENKRSYAWMKFKEERSVDLPIIAWKEGTGKYAGKIGAVVVDYQGKRVSVGSGLSDQLRAADPDALVGRLIEVTYQHETEDRSLRHPRFVRFRDMPEHPGTKI